MPVTTFDIVHLLLPFLFCRRDQRPKLVQYVENITLAQALGAPNARVASQVSYPPAAELYLTRPVPSCPAVYPLLRFDAAILAVTAVVCGSRLITGVMDEQMNRGLVELVGSTVKRSLECRKVTCAHINLMNLVVTSEEAEQAHAEKIRANKAKRKAKSQISFKKTAAIAARLAIDGEIPPEMLLPE